MLEVSMVSSLRALLHKVIDYAGLFPPARLPLNDCLLNYAKHLKEREHWMLGRFVCPTTRLAEVGSFAFHPDVRLRVSALARGGNTLAEFVEGLQADRAAIAEVSHGFVEIVKVDALEARLPEEGSTADQVRALVQQCQDILPNGPAPTVVYETTIAGNWQPRLTGIVRGLSGSGHGFKLRTGGLDAAAFPSVEQVAAAIVACRDARVPIKFTAGLHHPFRRFDATVQTKMHGFLNVFVAGVLAHVGRLTDRDVQSLLGDEDPSHFRFDEEGLSGQGFQASTEQIRQARQVVLSFGSCSFDEPREDLQGLKLL